MIEGPNFDKGIATLAQCYEKGARFKDYGWHLDRNSFGAINEGQRDAMMRGYRGEPME